MPTKMLNRKLSSLQRRACHGVVPHNGIISSTTRSWLWLLYAQAKSEHSQACIILEASLKIAKGSRHPSAWNKLSASFLKVEGYLKRQSAESNGYGSH